MIDYLPPVLQRVRDFACLMEQYQLAFTEFWCLAKETEDNLYLMTAGELGISRWERLLEISPREGAPLEERRQVIIARIGRVPPYSWAVFLAFLTAVTGNEAAFEARISELTLEVRLLPRWREAETAVRELMRWVVPANVQTHLVRVYTTHRQLTAMTHGEMGAYSHWQLRNEVEIA